MHVTETADHQSELILSVSGIHGEMNESGMDPGATGKPDQYNFGHHIGKLYFYIQSI